jgi:hypothetical protein
MNRRVNDWAEFSQRWDGVQNFLMGGECIPFSFDMPAIDRVVSEMRDDSAAKIGSGEKGGEATD